MKKSIIPLAETAECGLAPSFLLFGAMLAQIPATGGLSLVLAGKGVGLLQ